jgi:uncharacterized protein YjbJ (UPF0337 family)
MDENRFEGGVKDIAGKVEDAVGGLTGDTETQARGKARQAEGQIQQTYGQVADNVRDFASENPVGSLLAAAGVGLVLGLIIGRR